MERTRRLPFDDLEKWERQGRILEKPGLREEDGTIANHADVVVQVDQAYIFYFTHPGRLDGFDDGSYQCRRTSIQVARLDVLDGLLTCDRNESFVLKLLPDEKANQISKPLHFQISILQ